MKNLKQTIGRCMAALCAISLVSVNAWGQTANTLADADGNGFYDIASAVDLQLFATLVNEGNTTLNAELTSDIDLSSVCGEGVGNWTPIGNSTNRFKGVFDGNEHTVSGLYINDETASRQGLFGFCEGKINNVIVEGKVHANNYVGGICSTVYTDGEIRGCVNKADISSNRTATYAYVGGICGSCTYGSIYNSCNIGDVSAKSTQYTYVGGICGSSSSCTIENCFNTGSVSAVGTYAGGISGNASNASFKNVYNIGVVSSDASSSCGSFYGYLYNSTFENCYFLTNTCNVKSTATGIYEKRAIDFQNGSVCWLLNGCLNESDLKAGESLVWYQTLDSDDSPVFDNTHKTIFGYRTSCPDSPIVAKNDDNTLPEGANSDHHTYHGGFCVCGLAEEGYSGTFEIGNAKQLQAFAKIVNSGNKTANAIITTNIDLADVCGDGTNGSVNENWTPIGSSSSIYEGTFDGQNHKITGLYYKSGSWIGLFGQSKGIIKNLDVTGQILEGYYYAGGICASMSGGSMFNCIFRGTVTDQTKNNTKSSIGGVCGSNSTGTIEKCINYATVTTINNISSTSDYKGIGGVAGQSTGSLIECENYGEVSGLNVIGGVCGYIYSFNEIKGCVNHKSGTVTGTGTSGYVGGVFGAFSSSEQNVVDCHNEADVSGYSYVGGVSGQANYTPKIENCTNSGTITGTNTDIGGVFGNYSTYSANGTCSNCENTGDVTGKTNVGGICGKINDTKCMDHCVNTGNITATTSNAGGIAGYNSASYHNPIDVCCNLGNVSCTGTGTSAYAGGLVGFNGGYIDRSFNTGQVTSGKSGYAGLLIGYGHSTTYSIINNCVAKGASTDKLAAQGSSVINDSEIQSDLSDGMACLILNRYLSVAPTGETLAWYQNIGDNLTLDDYPVWSNDGHAVVYGKKTYANCTDYTWTYFNHFEADDETNKGDHRWNDYGFCTGCEGACVHEHGYAHALATDKDDVAITYNRTFATTKWQSLYVPFALSYNDWKDKCEVAEINDVHQFFDENGEVTETRIEFRTVTSGEILPNIPYVIRPKEGVEDISINFTGTLYAAPSEDGSIDCSSARWLYTLKGVYAETNVADKYVMYEGNFVICDASSDNLQPGRIYLEITPRTGGYNPAASTPLPRKITVAVDGEITDIEGIEFNTVNDAPAYNLHGIQVGKGHKGVVIQNGKKLIKI